MRVRTFVAAAAMVAAAAAQDDEATSTQPVCERSLASSLYMEGPDDLLGNFHYYMGLGASGWIAANGPPDKAICKAETWALVDKAVMKCPLRLEVVGPDDADKLMVCLHDNFFEPMTELSQATEGHPEVGVARRIVAVGDSMEDGRRMGCEPGDFAGRDFTDSIAVVVRGQCTFMQKATNAKAAGAKAAIVVNSASQADSPYKGVLYETISMGGSTEGIEDMAVMMGPRQHGIPLFNMVDAQRASGTAVTGSLAVRCDKTELVNDNDPGFVVEPDTVAAIHATCPSALMGPACDGEPDPAMQLCKLCPVGVTHPKFGTLCLYQNDLLPRRARTLLQFTMSLPATVAEGDVVLAGAGVGTMTESGGCVASDYEGLAGKTVALTRPTMCMPFEAVLAAQEAGVVGMWFLSLVPSTYGPWTAPVDGRSHGIHIPVHTMSDVHAKAMLAVFQAGPLGALTLEGNVEPAPVEFKPGKTCDTEPVTCMRSLSSKSVEPNSFSCGHYWLGRGATGWWSQGDAPTHAAREETCDPDKWELYDKCVMKCPLRLELASPASAADMMVCLHDNGFKPYTLDGHLHDDHAENGRVRSLLALGESMDDPRRMGCTAEDYGGNDYRNSIAVVLRGGCAFDVKAFNAKSNGAVALIVVNDVNQFTANYDQETYQRCASHTPPATESRLIYGTIAMPGSASGLEDFPAMMAPSQHGLPLLRELDAQVESNTLVQASLVMSCDGSRFAHRYDNDTRYVAEPETEAALKKNWCPHAALAPGCKAETKSERRLCEACPVEVKHPALGEPVCLYNNDLMPRRARTLLQLSTTLPATTVQGDVVVLPGLATTWQGPANMPGEGCFPSDFEGLAGKTVVVRLGYFKRCAPVEVVLAAQQSGVAAVWFGHMPYQMGWPYQVMPVDGMSREVNIPVHTMSETHLAALNKLLTFVNETVPFGAGDVGTGHVLPALDLAEGALAVSSLGEDVVQVDEGDAGKMAPVDEVASGFEFTAVAAIMLVLALALLGLLVARLATMPALTPVTDEASGFTLSLSMATIALSVSLLTAVGASAFAMAHASGVSSFDDATVYGRDAVDTTYTGFVGPYLAEAKGTRDRSIRRIKAKVEQTLKGGAHKVEWAAGLYGGGGDSFDAFNGKFVDFVKSAFETQPSWRSYVYMKNGYFASQNTRTAARRSPVNESCELYDLIPRPSTAQEKYWEVSTIDFAEELSFGAVGTHPLEMLGAGLGDPLAVTDGLASDELKWHVSSRSRVNWDRVALGGKYPNYNRPSLSIFAPVTVGGATIGTAEVRMPLFEIETMVDLMTHAGTSRIGTAMFDLDSHELLGASTVAGQTVRADFITSVAATGAEKNRHGGLDLFEAVDTLDSVMERDYLRALRAVLQDEGITSSTRAGEDGLLLSVEYDERDHYTARDILPQDVLQIAVDQAGKQPVDVSDRAQGLVFTGGVRVDEEAGRSVMAFAGSNASFLTVDTGNITVDSKYAQRNSPYEQVMDHSPARCVGTKIPGRGGPSTECLQYPHVWDSNFSITVRVKPAETYTSMSKMPVLFDSGHGDVGVKLFANGALWFGPVDDPSGTCMTRVPENGVKKDEWTTITAVVRRGMSYYEACGEKCVDRQVLDAAGRLLPWTDPEGHGCDAYEPYGAAGERPCAFASDEMHRNHGLLPAEACCVCVGGSRCGVASAQQASCAVYINGELQDQRMWTPGVGDKFTEATPVPVQIAEGLNGYVDYVGVEAYDLSESLIGNLHETLSEGGATRGRVEHAVKPNSTKWFVDVAGIDVPKSSLRWGVAAMIKRDNVVEKNVDRIMMLASQRFDANMKNADTRMQQRTGEAALVLVVIALLSIVVFVMFNGLITAPFHEITVTMMEAATMSAETVPDTKSFLREITHLQGALGVMVANLKEYRSYMPQSVLVVNTTADQSESSGSETDTSTQGSASVKSTSDRSSKSSSRRPGVLGRAASQSQLHAATGLAFVKRQATLVVLNVVGFHKVAVDYQPRKVLQLHGHICDTVVSKLTAYGGIAEWFSGDRFLGSFNAAKLFTQHRRVGPRAASAIMTAVGRECLTVFEPTTSDQSRDGVNKDIPGADDDGLCGRPGSVSMTAACAAVSGRMGNMGCSTMKKYTFVSPGTTQVFAMERYARHWNLKQVPVIDETLQFEAMRTGFTCALLPVRLSVEHEKDVGLHLYIPRDEEAHEENEWMYELDAAAELSPYKSWNALVDAVRRCFWDEAQSLLPTVGNIALAEPMRVFVTEAVQRNDWQPPIIESCCVTASIGPAA
eukprot:TRINITY_DN320_c0_g1_i5.p1 TRINITY_DN320_c0_g1~~TRINITY_DN320_c0_g1_i5.p1  ORF type:complete len:2268 (+),score=672.24 TRINITY_DN320_c0_g1_i5:86-6889(+)